MKKLKERIKQADTEQRKETLDVKRYVNHIDFECKFCQVNSIQGKIT